MRTPDNVVVQIGCPADTIRCPDWILWENIAQSRNISKPNLRSSVVFEMNCREEGAFVGPFPVQTSENAGQRDVVRRRTYIREILLSSPSLYTNQRG